MQEEFIETDMPTKYEIAMSWQSSNALCLNKLPLEITFVDIVENFRFIRWLNKYFPCLIPEFLINPNKKYYYFSHYIAEKIEA